MPRTKLGKKAAWSVADAEVRYADRLRAFQRRVRDLADDDRTELHRLERALNSYQEQRRLWNHVLSADDRARLGGNFARISVLLDTVGIWSEARGITYAQSLLSLSARRPHISRDLLAQLRYALGEELPTGESALEEFVRRYRLVVIQEPFAVYWDGDEVTVDWAKYGSWREFFQVLCERSKEGGAAGSFDFNVRAGSRALYYRKRELVNDPAFPKSLAKLISGNLKTGYLLDLPPEEIRILTRTMSKFIDIAQAEY